MNLNHNVPLGLQKVSPRIYRLSTPERHLSFCPFFSEVNLVPKLKIIFSGFDCISLHKWTVNLFTRLAATLGHCTFNLRPRI